MIHSVQKKKHNIVFIKNLQVTANNFDINNCRTYKVYNSIDGISHNGIDTDYDCDNDQIYILL